MANKNINSPVVDTESGSIDFPFVKVDAKEVFLHNYSAFMDRINVINKDKPKKWLFTATNSDEAPIELTPTNIIDKNYSHTELRSAVNDPTYRHPATTSRTDYTVKDTTSIFMTDDESDEEGVYLLDDKQIAFSFELGRPPTDYVPDQYILLARRMNKFYNVGDIAYTTSRSVPSYMRLRCVKSGTTLNDPFVLVRNTI